MQAYMADNYSLVAITSLLITLYTTTWLMFNQIVIILIYFLGILLGTNISMP